MNETSWGMRFNEVLSYQHFNETQKPQGCPDWFESHQINSWKEQGLVVWNNIVKKVVVLNGNKSLRLLRQLESDDHWKSEGVSITEVGYQFEIQIPPRGRRKKAEQEPKTETTTSEPVQVEILHLPPEAGLELIDLLNKNKIVISNMAEQEKKRFDDAMKKFFVSVLEFTRKEELSNFNFSVRAFQWQPNGPSRWVCKQQAVDGYVCLEKSKWFLCACVKKRGLLKRSEYFENILSAVEWTEKEMVDLANQTEAPDSHPQIQTEQQRANDLARLRIKLKDGPYWIDPLVMEPKQISYKIRVEIDTKPTEFRTLESNCGDILHFDERFPSPSKLANATNLDLDHFNFFQPAGENSEWHLITSQTTFYKEASAAEQAQKVWDQSRIVQQFKDGKIRRSRFGYQEVESGFETYLGACEDLDSPWGKPETREEYMEQLALRESISFSLDIGDFRNYLGVFAQTISDERILRIMHKTRARSKYMTEEIKIESKMWLAQHDSAE